jgi:membrane associated rhomboid family serine protease
MKVLNYFDYNSYVTLTMFFISLIVLILGYITRGKSTEYLFSTSRGSLLKPRTYIRLFTHILGHSNWSHFRNNYLIILLLGPMIEEKYGWLNYLIMILITSFITGIVNFIKGSTSLRGASNISFMLIVLSAFVNVTSNKIPLTLVLVSIFYIVDEVKDIGKKDSVAHYGHITGAICGLVFGFLCLNDNLINAILNIFK